MSKPMQGTGVVGRAREGHGWVRKEKEGIIRNCKEMQVWVGMSRECQQGAGLAMQAWCGGHEHARKCKAREV